MTSLKRYTTDLPRVINAGRGRVLLFALALLLALAAAPPWAFEGRASSQKPKARVVASACMVNVCNRARASVRLKVEGLSRSCSGRYRWEVDGGHIVGEGREVVWDLADTGPSGRFYEARLTVEGGSSCGGGRVVEPTRVLVWD